MRTRFALATGAGLIAVALALGGAAAGGAMGRTGVAGGSPVAALSSGAPVVPAGMMGLRFASWPTTLAGGWAAYQQSTHVSYCGAHGGILAQRQVGS